MSTLSVANVIFESTGANRIEYTGNNVIRVRANGGFQLPFGTTAQRASGDTGLMRYNTDTGLVETYGSGAWAVVPDGVTFNVAYTTANAGYVVANAAFGKANTALQNTSGTFAGNLTVTGNVAISANTLSVGSNNISPFAGMKNRIINGNFEFWQRGSSVTLVPNTLRWLADRWTAAGYQQGRHQRVSVTSPPTGLVSRYALRVGSSTTGEVASGTRMASRQKIESVNCLDLSGQVVTLSFWIKFSAGTISSISNTGQSAYSDFYYTIMFNTTSTDSDAGGDVGGDSQSYVGISNGSLPTTWTKYTLTATVPAGCNNISVNFQFGALGSTSSADSAYYDVTQVQLEAGPVATSFEWRPYGQELALCQRYFCKSYNVSVNPGSITDAGAVQIEGATSAYKYQYIPFKVSMRTAPTITTYNPSNGSSGKAIVTGNVEITGDAQLIGNDGFIGGMNVSPSSYQWVRFHWTAQAEI